MRGKRDTENGLDPSRRVSDSSASRQRLISVIAGRQKGNIARRQLRACGLGPDAIDSWLKSGRLIAKHRGVYRLGHEALPEFSDELAAVLACGDSAFVSYADGCRIWRILKAGRAGPVSILVAGRNPGPKPGIRIHRTQSLPDDEVTRRLGIPVTTPARALLDFASEEDAPRVERAINEAHVLGLARPEQLRSLIARHPRHRGVSRLRPLVDPASEAALTRSDAERRFLALIRAAKLPLPRVNTRLGAHEVDFVWTQQRLAVEVDGFRYHSSRHAFERDRARDVDIAALGYTVIRATWHQIVDEPFALVARFAQALASAG